MLLAEFNVIKPDPGLFFWTVIIFVVLWFILGKKAFGPIAKALKDREDSIKDALAQADVARAEMSNLKSENEQLLVLHSGNIASQLTPYCQLNPM